MPKFFEQLGVLMKDFPLWSGIMVPFFKSNYKHAPSAFCESHFCDRKTRMLSKYGRPIRADRFVKIELEDQKGSVKLFNSKLIRSQDASCHSNIPPTDRMTDVPAQNLDDSDLLSYENWKNRGKPDELNNSRSDQDSK